MYVRRVGAESGVARLRRRLTLPAIEGKGGLASKDRVRCAGPRKEALRDEALSDEVCGMKLCGMKLCGMKLCGMKLCGMKLCGMKLCGMKLCGMKLCGMVWIRRVRAGGRGSCAERGLQ